MDCLYPLKPQRALQKTCSHMIQPPPQTRADQIQYITDLAIF